MKVIRKKLAPSVAFAFPTRYIEETDTVQASFDGGTTWEAFPEGDPRLNNHTPPLSTTDPRCDAAARISAGTEEVVNYIIAEIDLGATALTILQGAIRLLTPLFTYIPYLALFYSAINAVLAIGSAAMHSAFDTFNWNTFKCILYCRLDTTGRLDAEGFEALLRDIATTYSGTVETVLFQLYANTGFAGLNDQSGIREETGDCSGCGTCAWDLCIDLSYLWQSVQSLNSPGGGVCPAPLSLGSQGTLGTYGGYPAIVAGKTLGDNANRIGKRFTLHLPPGCNLTLVYLSFVRSSGNTDQFTKVLGFNGIYTCFTGAFHNSPKSVAVNLFGDVMLYLGLGTTVAADGTTIRYRQLRLIGTGVKPNFPTVPFVSG